MLQRETGLDEVAETGVMIHGHVSADLLGTIFTPKSPLHDGAVIIHDEQIVAAGALLPLAETSIHTERFGTRHRAALGITEQTDAVVVVVSEENGQISLVERARIVRNLTEPALARAIQGMLDPTARDRDDAGRTIRPAGTRAGRLVAAAAGARSPGQLPDRDSRITACDPAASAPRRAPDPAVSPPATTPVTTTEGRVDDRTERPAKPDAAPDSGDDIAPAAARAPQ